MSGSRESTPKKTAPAGGRYSIYQDDPTYDDPEQIAARRRIYERTRQLNRRRPASAAGDREQSK